MRPSEGGQPKRVNKGEVAGYLLVVAAVWLAWEVVKVPVTLRAPPSIAVRVAPGSPEVLRRAAESELGQNRVGNARALAQESLQRAPFNARALRVRGLAEARAGRPDRADEMLTLAGNWSLRDDPAHAWLVENRLRRGDYASSFAHADTLARRRAAVYPQVFALYRVAALNDERAVRALVRLLSTNPPWRSSFFQDLQERDEATQLAATLAIALQRTSAPLSRLELELLYADWYKERRFAGLRQLRTQLGRPPVAAYVQNHGFEEPLEEGLRPFAWISESSAGISVAVIEDDLRANNMSLRVEYDGYGSFPVADQLLMLDPGSYRLTAEARFETPPAQARLVWKVRCAETGETLLAHRAGEGVTTTGSWTQVSAGFVVPSANCSAQRLTLDPDPGARRTNIVTWFDNVVVSRVNPRL